MPSRSAAAFRASVRDRLKTEAKKCGRPVKELQREFVLALPRPRLRRGRQPVGPQGRDWSAHPAARRPVQPRP
jgi:hypothetical protein